MSEETKLTVKGRLGALALTLFFLPFLGFGLFALVIGGRQALFGDGGVASRVLGGVVALVFGLIFSGVGGIGVIACLGTALGFVRPSVRPGAAQRWQRQKKRHIPGQDQKADCFPPLRDLPRGPAGGALLDPETDRGMKATGMWFLAAFWNGITWVAIILNLKDGGFAWIPIIFFSIFALIGLAIIGGAVKETLRAVMVGDTSVEIPREPVAIGDRFRVTVYQKGSFSIDQVRVSIACREEATYQHGSSSSTAKEIFWEETVAIASSLTAPGGGELLHGEATIPPQAMHSFKSRNNTIKWGVRVVMELPGRPDTDDFFEFRVEPPR